MEHLARKVVEEAVREGSFNVFSDEDLGKTPLQKAISRMSWSLLHWHYPGDGCLDH
jgi:hypothetical protein